MTKIRSIATAAVFIIMLAGLGAAHLLLPDSEISVSERRPLSKPPVFSAETVFSGEYSDELETYLLDQFPMRDGFHTLNALTRFGLLREKDVDGIYYASGSLSELDKYLDEKHVAYCGSVFEQYAEDCFGGARLFVAAVPDKNAVLAEPNGYPSIDYGALEDILRENTPSMEYVSLFGLLDADDYYATDSHWRQESLGPVLGALSDALGIEFSDISEYNTNELYPFRGVYAGQSALPVPPDTLVYLTNDMTDAAIVDSYESGEMPVYTTEKFEGIDGYDVFLGGAQAFITIENPLNPDGRELVLFRDSFGSSLAPLLLSGYRRVTIVDPRYIMSSVLPQLIDTSDEANANRDVLFMLSSTMLNGTVVFR